MLFLYIIIIMKKFTAWLSAKLIKDHKNIRDPEVRARYGTLEGVTSILLNTILFGIKITTGIYLQSIALIADAIHTLSDSVTSIIVIIGFKAAKKPSDKEHPFGHGRMEYIAALIVSVFLFVAAFEFLEGSIRRIINPVSYDAPIGIIILITLSMAAKELIARFSFALGNIIKSKTLEADAIHHRTDAVSTALVIVALISSRFGIIILDGIMGVFVSIIIFYSAYRIAKGAIDPLLGEAPSKETVKEIENIARSNTKVSGVHDMIFHKYGQTSIISLHIEVSDKESAAKLHMLAEEIEEKIIDEMGGIAIVHIDPINKDHPKYNVIAEKVRDIVSHDERIQSFHELRIVGWDIDKCTVIFDIVLEASVKETELSDIIQSIIEKFKPSFPQIKLVIKNEPKYVYNY